MSNALVVIETFLFVTGKVGICFGCKGTKKMPINPERSLDPKSTQNLTEIFLDSPICVRFKADLGSF